MKARLLRHGHGRLLLAALTAALSLSLAISAALALAGDTQQWPDPDSPLTKAQLEEGKARAAAWEAARNTPEAAAEREQSRAAFADQSDAGALTTAQTQFSGWLTAPVYDHVPVADGQTLVRYLGDDQAEIDGPGDHRAALFSTVPLIGKTPDGDRAPVDLHLTDVAGGYAPRSSSSQVVLPANASGLLRFPGQGFSVSIAGARNMSAELTHDRLFFANVHGRGSSADAVVEAARRGAEISWVLRARSSPEDEVLQFHLPGGAHIELAGGSPGQQSATIVGSDGKPLGVVFPAAAVDAQGAPVPVSYSLASGDRLVVHVAHRDGDFAYPILADPLVATWYPGMYGAWNFAANVGGVFSAGADASSYTYTSGPGTAGQGAYGQYGQWAYGSLAGAYIYREDSYSVWHFPNNSEEFGGLFGSFCGQLGTVPGGCGEVGTWQDTVPSNGVGPGGAGSPASRYQTPEEHYVNTTYCAQNSASNCTPPTHGTVGAPNNAVTAGLWLLAAVGYPGYIPKSAVYGEYLYESDDIVPSTSGSLSGFGSGWRQSQFGSASITGSVSTGLGMYYVEILRNGSTYSTSSASSGGWPYPFSYTGNFSPSVLEGTTTFSRRATNQGGNTSSATAMGTVCRDSRLPTASETGTFWNSPNDTVVASQSTSLNVSSTDGINDGVASDQQSGVASITTTIKDATGATKYSNSGSTVSDNGTTLTCIGGSYSADRARGQTNSVDTTNWLPGQYTMTVVVTDAAGNSRTDSKQITLASTLAPVGTYSNTCTSPTAQILDGYASGIYVTLRVQPNPNNSNQQWVCYRASNGGSVNFGGRVDVSAAFGLPSSDTNPGACETQGYVAPPLAGEVAGTPFVIGASTPTGAAWICVQVGSFQERVIVPIGTSGTGVVVNQDMPGIGLPSPTADPYPSGTCQNGVGGSKTQLANADLGNGLAHVWAYEWQPDSSTIDLCARLQGPVSAGGVASATTSGTISPVFGSDSNVAACTIALVTLTSPVQETLRISAPGSNPQSICVGPSASAGTRYYVGTSGGLPGVTWTPDPGTP